MSIYFILMVLDNAPLECHRTLNATPHGCPATHTNKARQAVMNYGIEWGGTRAHLCAAVQGLPAAARMSHGPWVDASDAARRSDSAATVHMRAQLFIVERI